jgi:hypothetical protein
MNPITDPNRRIVIVGAGQAGLATARYLNRRGFHDVTILEKFGRVGGLCHTITEDGKSYDLGANYVTRAYRETLKRAREVGATTYTEAPYSAVTVPSDGSPVTHLSLLAAVREYGPPDDRRTHSLWKVLRAALKYAWLRFRLRRIIDRPSFVEIHEHPELSVSFADWLKRHDIQCLTTMFEIPITMMGYNYLPYIAAPYALKYMSLATYIPMVLKGLPVIQRIVPWPRRFTYGFQRLWQRMSWNLNVRLNVDIEQIERDEGGITVRFTQLQKIFNETKTHQATMRYDYLILACPLAPDVLSEFMDLRGRRARAVGADTSELLLHDDLPRSRSRYAHTVSGGSTAHEQRDPVGHSPTVSGSEQCYPVLLSRNEGAPGQRDGRVGNHRERSSLGGAPRGPPG